MITLKVSCSCLTVDSLEVIMSDKVSKEKRSEIMSHIKGKDTTIEIAVRKYLYSKGIRYRKNVKEIPGSPDISIKKYKIAIFINGCFWHGHQECKYFHLPKSNVEFWQNKIERNIERDEQNYQKLSKDGWLVIILWECEIKGDYEENMLRCYNQILNRVNT